MTRHLKPLYIKAFINGRPINWVLVNEGAILNVMPIVTLKKLSKGKSNLISINMKKTNFTGDVIVAIGVLVADIIVRCKTLSLAFFVVDVKPTYSMLLRRDWIHFS